jgi:hypothetical protein
LIFECFYSIIPIVPNNRKGAVNMKNLYKERNPSVRAVISVAYALARYNQRNGTDFLMPPQAKDWIKEDRDTSGYITNFTFKEDK